MAAMKFALFISFVYVAHSTLLPDESSWMLDSMKKQLTWRNDLALTDRDRKPFIVMNMTLEVYGDKHPNESYFKTLVTDKLAHIQDYHVEPTGLQLLRGLPLKFNLTLFEIITTGPKPVKNIGVAMQVLVYSNKKHQDQAVSVLKYMV